jgi:PAS domain S-box-containing protein
MNRILIVDDKPENLYYLKALLEGHGWLVDEARHGAEALVKARLNTPLIVVSDLLMPVMDGYTLLRHWKTDSNLSSIPFVVYTATYTEPEDERLALSLGADAFILKPSEPEHFLKALAEALERREAPKTPSAPMDSEDAGPLLNYSRTLIRKLEEKSLQLEKANEALLKDLQQRRNVEEALRQSEERFQLAVQGSTAGIWDWDIRSGTCYLSPRYHEMLDYSTEELAHRVEAFYAIVHPDDRAMVEKALHDHFSKDRKPYHVEFRMRSKSGTYRWFRATGQAVYDGSGTAYRMVGSTLDITEQKASEIRLMQALKEAEQFREALDHVPAHIYMKDLDSRYLYANRHTLQLFGCEASELRGKGDWDFFPPTAAHHLREIDLRVFSGEQTAEEITVNSPNGDTTVFWEIKTPLYEDPTHQKICGLLGISTDITSKKTDGASVASLATSGEHRHAGWGDCPRFEQRARTDPHVD